MPAPVFLDLSHTAHTHARTGIQRVVRALVTALGGRARPITHDPHLGAWRLLEPWETANLAATAPAAKRGAQWPLAAKLRGRTRRLLGAAPAISPQLLAAPKRGEGGSSLNASGLIVPEIFSPAVAAALPALFAATPGPRLAIFHDAIALKFPELTPAKTVARFPAYLRELLAFDGIAAISEDSRNTLLDYWRWLGVPRIPPVRTIPLGIDAGHFHVIRESGISPAPPIVLSVGSLEGRKNHLALLEACESLWARGLRFELHLIGLAHPQTGRAALDRLRALQAAGRPLRYDGPVDDDALESAYAACAFTVYPSLMEGFGLPVLESLARGKPCICSARGALGESAAGGGCRTLEGVTAPSLAGAIGDLLTTPSALTALATAARARKFRTQSDYAADLTAWLSELPRRA